MNRVLAFTFKSERGQSLVETLVVTLAMVPLLFLGVWIGKLADIQLATGAAARKLAFDCVQRRADCQNDLAPDLVDIARRHFLSQSGREVMSSDTIGDSPDSTTKHPLWTSHNGAVLLEKFSDVSASVTNERLDGPSSHIANSNQQWVSNVANHLSNLAGPGRFGFDLAGGFINARIQTKVSPSSPTLGSGGRLEAFPLTMRRNVAILGDAWEATGSNNGRADSYWARVQPAIALPLINGAGEAALGAAYAGTRAGMALMGAVGLEPNVGLFRWHEVDPSIIPLDRTRAGPAAAVPATPSVQPPIGDGA
jgi:hypothetical protein